MSEAEEDRNSQKVASFTPVDAVNAGGGTLPTTEVIRGLKTKLKISSRDLHETFAHLKIPHHIQRIQQNPDVPSSSRDARYHKASTLTRKILREHDWRFPPPEDDLPVPGLIRSLPDEEIYKDIVLESTPGEFLNVFTSPAVDIHPTVHAALNNKRQRFVRMKTISLPRDWFSMETRYRRSGIPLEIPLAFREALDVAEEIMKNNAVPPTLVQEIETVLGEPPSTPNQRETRSRAANNVLANGRMASLSPGFASDEENTKPGPFSIGAVLREGEAAEREEAVRAVILRHKLEVNAENAKKLQVLLKNEDTRRIYQTNLISFLEAKADGTTSGGIAMKTRQEMEEDSSKPWKGNPLVNEHADDTRFAAASMLCNWVTFEQPKKKVVQHGAEAPVISINEDVKEDKQVAEQLPESMVEILVAPLLVGLFWGHPDLKESKNEATRFADPLRFFGTTPEPDYAVRLFGKKWSHWTPLMALVMASGECKPIQKLKADTEAQLAMNSVATLVILILVYLSTRKSKKDPLPAWMFTMSFTYTQYGFVIYGHFPRVEKSPRGPEWKFVSWQIANRFERVWESDTPNNLRMAGLAVLYELRAHTEFVVKQIGAWSDNLPPSVTPIMERLIAKAHLDMKDYEWLIEKVSNKDVDGSHKQQQA
ncbi:hypothetical protein M408DRAFT_28817 [Serendipita vermifera MAFF 305830]|uniref:Uncharacterized protein n=1 Tax=Serendipita vermifera MAFF 305830 TaxID=933852 RepID=A0A0C2WY72_SERVB|nr:hypothetical protein M408DRAFT_28817 [Serendipita vermifera MAFF 305830]